MAMSLGDLKEIILAGNGRRTKEYEEWIDKKILSVAQNCLGVVTHVEWPIPENESISVVSALRKIYEANGWNTKIGTDHTEPSKQPKQYYGKYFTLVLTPKRCQIAKK